MMYYKLVINKNTISSEECDEYNVINGKYELSASYFNISHPNHKLRAITDCSFEEIINKNIIATIYGDEIISNRNLYYGLDYESANEIIKTYYDNNNF